MINIGKLGIWFSHNPMSIAESVAFAQRVEACGYVHYDAGADHVCILPLATTGRLPNMSTVEALAP